MLPSITFVSTYPPTRCGLATFTESLRNAIALERRSDAGLEVLAISSEPRRRFPPEVVGTIDPGRPGEGRAAATDFAILQHEYGIFGENDGEAVLDVVEGLSVPTVTVLHTVLDQPSPRQRGVVEELARESIGVVVLSQAAEARLRAAYAVDQVAVIRIPHGGWSDGLRVIRPTDRPVVLTWGLLGPGKGLEDAIRAMPALRDLDPRPLYVIAGQTHPTVLRTNGEAYRQYLEGLVADLGVQDMVRFVNRYLSAADLSALRRRAAVCLFPYESREQTASGALVDAIVGQVPVVATRFPHAVELLSGGAGRLIHHNDPIGIAAALRRLLTDRRAVTAARIALEGLAGELSWPRVARAYEALFQNAALDAGAA